MLRPTVTAVRAEQNHSLRLTFDNGEVKRFDVTPYIRGEWYSALADEAYFNMAFANGYTVEWPDGQDLCPDELYHNSVPAV
ncbi:MAG: DUF2442 domain-containing protein [Clostridia bacterium]|nr:DUF2442 domain-containing protein [Clostridia bacterium]